MSTNTQVINTIHTKPVQCIDNFDKMTLEERLDLTDKIMNDFISTFFGPNYKIRHVK